MARRILLVDDEPDFVEMIQMRLEANGYEVLTAYDGTEGMKTAEAEKPDLILLDVMMPGLDGLQVLRRLRRSEAVGDTPVIMLTARGESKAIMQAQKYGTTDYLIKPCESKDLLALVKKYA